MTVDLLNTILNRHTLSRPCIIEWSEKEAHMPDFTLLRELGILEDASSANARLCPACEDENAPVHIVSDTRAYTLCTRIDEAGRDYFHTQELKRWEFKIDALLNSACGNLQIIKNAQPATDTLQVLGETCFNKQRFTVLYFYGEKLAGMNNAIDTLTTPTRNIIILTNTEFMPLKLKTKKVITIPLAQLATIKQNALIWDKKRFEGYLGAMFQTVRFELNGDLIVHGKRLGNITPSTPEYFFVKILYKNFNKPVSNKKIFTYCKTKLNKNDYSDTPQIFCGKRKHRIKNICNKNAFIDIIFQTSKTKNGLLAYKITIP